MPHKIAAVSGELEEASRLLTEKLDQEVETDIQGLSNLLLKQDQVGGSGVDQSWWIGVDIRDMFTYTVSKILLIVKTHPLSQIYCWLFQWGNIIKIANRVSLIEFAINRDISEILLNLSLLLYGNHSIVIISEPPYPQLLT